ncbi:MAG: hypothetical protein HON53_09530 [Planctomycetaceae bacterium]|jgi:hypothetical protein|nr:hypothetical protein [Planctomycetaceae bacterium]MBT6153443.1 hypothetical protein [Planctomycetaceae bacterium]MBT6484725.1 hypothetical protein [Planctomycetaceae bacterium]MBT6496475.1 hypothetical protein [Planctomycetaceae bacterium]
MADLSDLSTVSGTELTEAQIKGILAQIDLDVTNLLRDGKLSALKYGLAGQGGHSTDRAANLKALLEARSLYEQLLKSRPSWEVSQFDDATG